MNMKPVQDNLAPIQLAIYRLALSLDSLLVNGIQYGVILRLVGTGFLQERADRLLRDLAILEKEVAAVDGQPDVARSLTELSLKSRELIDAVTRLASFRAFSPSELSSRISQVLTLREECVLLIQRLEAAIGIEKSFYSTRPTDLTNSFFANLERILTQEWVAAHPETEATRPVGEG